MLSELMRCLILATLALCGTAAYSQEASAPSATPDAATAPSTAPAKKPGFFDPDDGYLDLSHWLLSQNGFLPVPVIITEPAVGYGGGMALTFFSQSMQDALENSKTSGHVTPPDIYAGAAIATENGSRAYGGGAMLSFLDDKWRYRGVMGQASMNLDFYGVGSLFGKEYKLDYNLDGFMSSQQVLYRLGQSSDWLAARWIYLDLNSTFKGSRPLLPERSLASKDSGLGLSWEHDSRNTIFTPSRGVMAAVDTMFYSPSLGSDNTYQTYAARIYSYWPIGNSLILGGRLDGRAARGDVPFYQLPYLDLRGIPAVRYQDENTGVAEVEARWNLTDRWALIGFGGAGRAWGQLNFDEASTRVAKGVGMRYQLARVLNLWAGVDYAWGPDHEQALYIQVGSAWR